MDVEKTIEFLLGQQAQHDARMAEIERLMVRGAQMLVANQEAGRETDRRISALVEAQQATEAKSQATEAKFAELAKAQKATEASLKAYLDSLNRPGNGNPPRS